MCVAVPMRVVEVRGDQAVAEIDGVRREASLMLLDQEVAVGDYLIVHAGFAISLLDRDDALQTLALMHEALLSEPRV